MNITPYLWCLSPLLLLAGIVAIGGTITDWNWEDMKSGFKFVVPEILSVLLFGAAVLLTLALLSGSVPAITINW